jgi:host factor-I protein
MAEFEQGLPSVRQIQSLIKKKQTVAIKLTTGDLLTGKVIWQDSQCLYLVDGNQQPLLIWRQSLAYLKPIA